jgi:dihydrofolate synthase/folylpolyglutamate synthase
VPAAPPLTSEALLAPRLEQRILPGLERIRHALDLLGHPEERFPAVLIVGTNGKGSTAALLASVLGAHGVRTGLYTSPHLVAVQERISIDGDSIAEARLVELLGGLAQFPELSYFEALTVAAFQHFAAERVEIAILEAGLGGRWDATNTAGPVVSLLTNVGTDHQQWLGATRLQIAAEKAAALSGRAAIIGAWDAEVEPVIHTAAAPMTPLTLASGWAQVERTGNRKQGTEQHERRDTTSLPPSPSPLPSPLSSGRVGAGPRTPGPVSCGLHGTPISFAVAGLTGNAVLPLLGEHQLANLRLALAGAAALVAHGVVSPLRADAIARGIESTRWPGRLHWLEHGDRWLLLDGAHNQEAAAVLANALDEAGLSGSLHLLFSCLSDKPLEVMAELLRPRVAGVTLVVLDAPRGTEMAALAQVFPEAKQAPSLKQALAELPADRPTLVTGSLRLVGEVLRLIENG